MNAFRLHEANCWEIKNSSTPKSASASNNGANKSRGPRHSGHGLISCPFVALLVSASIAAAGPKPLTRDQILQLLRNGVYSNRVAALVTNRGIDFVPTADFLRSLQLAGA